MRSEPGERRRGHPNPEPQDTKRALAPLCASQIRSLGGANVSPIQVLDHYQEGDSLIHCLDARIKLALTLATILVIAALPRGAWLAYLACLLMICLVTAASHLPPLLILRRSLVAIPFALAALSLVFTVPGSSLATLTLAGWNLSITKEGLVAFCSILAKAWLSVLSATLLVSTTPFTYLVASMRAFRVPEVLVSVVSFMYRYMYVIADEALRLNRARQARSATPGPKAGGSLRWRAKVLGGMIGSLFLRSYERSERVYAAMLSRGFDGSFRTVKMEPLRRHDLASVVAFFACLLAVAALAAFQRGP
jgi:cobalt/nickel transport system permease protein